MLFSTRFVVGLTALLVGSLVWFSTGVNRSVDAATFGRVLEKVAEAETLQLKISRDGINADVWIRKPGDVRWEDSPVRYRIASGSTLWEVDESANQAVDSANPWQRGANESGRGSVDLLALLGLNQTDSNALRNARPSERILQDGRLLHVYRLEVTSETLAPATPTPTTPQKLVVEAVADAKTHELQSLVAWPAGLRKRVGPPVAELRLVAFNLPVDDDKFVVAKSLTEDGRIGKISDAQGIVTIKPVLSKRWTPVCRQLLLKPGDWVRTDIRGANAVLATLSNNVQVTIGPGSLVEFTRPDEIRLHGGELQLTGMQKTDGIKLLGPLGTKALTLKGKSVLVRADVKGSLVEFEKKPLWLAGFEGSAINESIGSLIAIVDGRNEPLSVGYHKVQVEIRDQIARTTIEESFVNNTNGRLEGVFHFPLPQDASISGFGMWIGNELVEADVVEKQRAREIYETILREKRDPGLLEWTGGNIFKARVFPIEPHSEKRIKIVYTQMLPLRANQYRYSYGLKSEMLQTKPLRELSIDVLVNSSLPLKHVSSPTHAARADQTAHSAHLEFSAQEYSPDRDFELVCTLGGRTSDVVMIPHQRGDDGYFLVQLMPPGPQGNWQREIVPDGEPLNLLLVCDTSASMDSGNRKTQADFVAAVLTSLGPNDTFNLATADVNCDWLFKDAVQTTAENIGKARDVLEKRISLGWTDLDRVFESVVKRADKATQVIYVGDGIVTAHNANPQDFAARLNLIYGKDAKSTFHAVSTGSSYESIVLKSIAAKGGGSMRQITGDQTASVVAMELLNEIAQPGLRDLNVEFRGIRVAGIYPDRLPNLAAGTQQILIGRYLPDGKAQSGQIVVTGKRGGEEVKFVADVSFADAEQGNSFIPRLWARQHLDHLLQQGSSDLIKDEIISMSEEFHIITPYTSLLVLETDADRARFGVKRRYQMRDGERFFADGKNNALYELAQQQMKRAANWRIGLRHQILAQLSNLGRSTQQVQQVTGLGQHERLHEMSIPMSGPEPAAAGMPGLGGWGGGGGFGGDDSGLTNELFSFDVQNGEMNFLSDDPPEPLGPTSSEFRTHGFKDGLEDLAKKSNEKYDVKGEMDSPDSSKLFAQHQFGDTADSPFDRGEVALQLQDSDASEFDKLLFLGARRKSIDEFELGRFASQSSRGSLRGGEYFHRANRYQQYSDPWINSLVPALSPVPQDRVEPPTPHWSNEALALSKSLLRIEALRQLENGLVLERDGSSTDPRWNRQTGRNGSIELWSKDRWLQQGRYSAGQTLINWCDKDERSVLSRTFQLGRTRRSTPADLEKFAFGTDDYSFSAIHESYAEYKAVVEPAGDNQVRLVLTLLNNESYQQVFTIDTTRNVLVESENRNEGKSQGKTVYSDFVQVGGMWWAGKVSSFDAKGRPTSTLAQTVKLLDGEAFAKTWATQLEPQKDVLMIRVPIDKIRVAEAAVESGKASVEHRLALLVRDDAIQKWDAAFEQLAELEKLAKDKPGTRWIRFALNIAARNNEVARQWGLAEATRLQQPTFDDYPQAVYIVGQCYQILASNEQLELLEKFKPVYDRVPVYHDAVRSYNESRITPLSSLGRSEEVLELRKQLAEARPWDVYLQTQYAQEMVALSGHDSAYAWLQQELDRQAERDPYELEALRNSYAELLRQQGRYDRLVEFLDAGIKAEPLQSGLYAQYLSALVFDNQSEKAEATIKQWMTEAIAAASDNKQLDQATQYKLQAAISLAQGQGYILYYYYVEPKWQKPLADTARAFVEHQHHFQFTSQIMHGSNFSDSDEADALRVVVWDLLTEKLDTLPADRVKTLIGWTLNGPPIRTTAEWRDRAVRIRKLWDKAEKLEDRQQFAVALTSIYQNHFNDTEYLPFLRAEIEKADDEHKPGHRLVLFQALIQQPWQLEIEVEAFALIKLLSNSEHESNRLAIQVPQLMLLLDRLDSARFESLKKAFEEKAHPENMTRTDYAKQLAAFRVEARKSLAAHVAEQAKKHEGGLAKWIEVESTYLDIRLDQNLDAATEFAWQILGDAPQARKLDDDAQAHDATQFALDRLLEARAFAIVSNSVARKSANKKLRDRVLEYCDKGLELAEDYAAHWKYHKYRILVAIDEPQQLEEHLRRWIANDEYVTDWRHSLAILLAEQGKLQEAIDLFERIEKDSQLSPGDYSMLADWYLVVDSRERFEKSKVETFKSMQEYHISNWIEQKRYPWAYNDRPLPSELDENVLFAFRALFEKSSDPGQYMYLLHNFYTACRDFRLLQMVPDALLGRTPQQVYSALERINQSLLVELRDEATADEILKPLVVLREVKGRTTVDLRALDLLEALIERKSSEVLNQPGPHVATSVAALKRAFEREWANGEERQMAAFLDSLGSITQADISAEQLRQLRALFDRVDSGTDDSLHIGWSYAHLLSSYGQYEKSITFMETVVRAYEGTHAEGWPGHANGPLDGYIGLLEGRSRFAEAETEVQRIARKPLNSSQKHWFAQRLNSVFVAALRGGGQVSLGSGLTLYRNILKRLLVEIETGDHNHRYHLLEQVLQLFDAAKQKQLAYQDDCRKYAFEQLPEVLKLQSNNYRDIVQNTSYRLQDLLGDRTALHFLIERAEQYPLRFAYSWENFWNQFGYRIGELRAKTGNALGDLEPRLLKLVLAELRRELETRNSRHTYTYYKHHSYYWSEKEDDFRRVAEDVLKERQASSRSVIYIANYLWNGLQDPHRERAIEVMFIAHGKGQLNDANIATLVTWLHDKSKYGKSIALLEPLVAKYPNSIEYSCQLITAYSQTKRNEQRESLWAKTDTHFRAGGRWTESNVARIARCAHDNHLNQRAIDLYRETIALRLRATGNFGTQDATLTYYYRELAEAYVREKKTVEAVDAISAAIVAWPNNHYERQNSLQRLLGVIQQSPDVDAYVAHCDAQLKSTGQDSPLIRKTLGEVFVAKEQFEKAIAQFKIALELQPFDIKVHESLIDAYTRTKNEDLAIQQLLTLVDIEKHNLSRFVQLAERMQNDEAQAERAATTIVESAPNEAENHIALATLRQTQNRWPDAIEHWKQAADLRVLEPTNLIHLADAQIHEKDLAGAGATLKRITSKAWPSRFEIQNDVRRLQQAVESKQSP